MELLQQNPAWRGHLAQAMDTVPEVTAEPEIHFVFQAEGNVPSVPLVRENRLYFGSGASFYALEAESGTVLWRRRRPGKTWSPVWLSEDCLYVCAQASSWPSPRPMARRSGASR